MKTESKTAIILGVAIAAVIVGISVSFSSLESTSFEPSQTIIQNEDTLQVTSIDKSRYKMAPDLVGIANYINTTPEQLVKEIEGKVVLYDIWTYSCINCVRTLPYITAWNEKYVDDGLLIIGIHSPEFEFEKDLNNVEMAVDKYGITYPVVLDNDMETWKAFENRYWPRKYLADHEGYIRYDHIGEGGYQETEKIIQQLLEERSLSLGVQLASAESLVDIEEFQHTSFRTPELYFGYKFSPGRNQLGNSEGFNPDNRVTYSLPEHFQQHYFYLEGTWENLAGSMKLVSDTGSIVLNYHAKEVNIVTANDADLGIFLDEKPIPTGYSGNDVVSGKVKTAEAGLYNIVNSEEPASHLLKIDISEPGFEIYTFTFG
jgi:thiol-disulfide isomerase/thioredoxin